MHFTKIIVSVTTISRGLSAAANSKSEDFTDTVKLKNFLKAIHFNKEFNRDIYAKLVNNPPFEIYPKGNLQFFGKKEENDFYFEITNDLITGLSAEKMGHIFHFKKDTL